MLIFIHNIILIYDICILLRMQSLRPRKGKKGGGMTWGLMMIGMYGTSTVENLCNIKKAQCNFESIISQFTFQ